MGLQHRIFKTGKHSVDHFYLCNYKPKRAGTHDRLSNSLLRFKNGLDPDVRAWIECSTAELAKKFTGCGASIIRALGHSEMVASDNTPLSKLCRHLQEKLALKDARSSLHKTKITGKLSLLPKEDRLNEILGNYFVEIDKIPTRRVLIIDDILTSGATMTSIIEALRDAMPSLAIKLFTFAVCDRSSDLNYSISLRGYDINWVAERGWQAAEDAELYGTGLEGLRARIMNDDF